MAETFAQIEVNGLRETLAGLRFRAKESYVFLTRGGGYQPWFSGSGVLPEAAALLATGAIAGIPIELRYQSGRAKAEHAPGVKARP